MTRCKEKLEAPLSQESSCGLEPDIPKVHSMSVTTLDNPKKIIHECFCAINQMLN